MVPVGLLRRHYEAAKAAYLEAILEKTPSTDFRIEALKRPAHPR